MTVTIIFPYAENDKDKEFTCESTNLNEIRKFVIQKQSSLKNKLFVLTKDDSSIPVDSVTDNSKLTIRKVTIVLDLDETLLHALSYDETPLKLQNNPPEGIFIFVMDDQPDDTNPYVIFVRPGLYPFLEHIFNVANVCIWTAASQDYALWIIKNILHKNENGESLTRDFKVFLSSHHCDISYDTENGHKVLSCFKDEFKLHNLDKQDFNDEDVCLLIDDSSSAKKGNSDPTKFHQCFKIKAFELDENGNLPKNDTALQNLVDELQPGKVQSFMNTLQIDKSKGKNEK